MTSSAPIYTDEYVSSAYQELESLLQQHFPGSLMANDDKHNEIFYEWRLIHYVMYTFKTRHKWPDTIKHLVTDAKHLGFGTKFRDVAFYICCPGEDNNPTEFYVAMYKKPLE